MNEYQNLSRAFHRINQLAHATAMLYWDEAVMMPPHSADARAVAVAELRLIQHEILNNKPLSDDLNNLQSSSEKLNLLDSWQRANLAEMARFINQANAVDKELVEAQALANSKSEHAWRGLRADNNWKDFLPIFKEVVKFAKEEAAQRSAHSGLAKYDCMLDLFNPGFLSQDITKVFNQVKRFLPSMVDEVIEKQKRDNILPLAGPFSIENQKQLGLATMKVMGFDFNRGRLDVSHHPFCGGVSEDVRITTRYDLDNFLGSFMGVVHESGHALYEQGLPRKWANQPVGQVRGMAIHESQSLLFEMHIGRSFDFINHLRPEILRAFEKSDQDPVWSSNNIIGAMTRVNKTYIRVSADEVTYPLHVILRFEIERDLIAGTIEVEDIPEIWNQKMQEYLGLSTDGNYKNGCMQDMHWPSGAFGYFPCYSLGSMMASQLMNTFKKAEPQYLRDFQLGDLTKLRDWLNLNIWSHGSFYSSSDLIKRTTGEDLNPEHLQSHLKARYLK